MYLSARNSFGWQEARGLGLAGARPYRPARHFISLQFEFSMPALLDDVSAGPELVVEIERGSSLIQARMKVFLSGLGGAYVEGQQLDDKTARKVPPARIGRLLSTNEATMLLERLER